MARVIVLSVAGGIVLFVWGFMSWAVLPWHHMAANKFTDEAAVAQVLKENAPQRGVYFLPFSEQDHGPDKVGAFANVLPDGTAMNMGRQMTVALVTQIASVFLVLSLMRIGGTPGCRARVGFFALTGLIIGFVSHAPYWNWFGFSTPYVAVIVMDYLIGWTLAGLAVACFMPRATPAA